MQESIRQEIEDNKTNPNDIFTKFPLAFSEKELY